MKCFVLLQLLLVFTVSSFSQNSGTSGPIEWTQYKDVRHGISVELPKKPLMLDFSERCSQTDKASYFAYADESVYEFTIVSKARKSAPRWCPVKRRFSLNERLDALRGEAKKPVETSLMVNGREVYRFADPMGTRWVVPDIERDRWIELFVVRRGDRRSEEQRFVDSLDLSGSKGVDLGGGVSSIIGDVVEPTTEPQTSGSEKAGQTAKTETSEPFRLLAKPKAKYTDTARESDVQGTVRLTVTLLRNGSVGAVTPLTTLPHGLTEQAISAARR